MADRRSLVDEAAETVARAAEPFTRTAVGTAELGAALAAQGIQASEAFADALTSALRSLPGKLREIEVPRIKHSLADVAEQLAAIAKRLQKLSARMSQASSRFDDALIQNSGKLIIEGFESLASVAAILRPPPAGPFRFVPARVSQPYLESLTKIEEGLRAAGDLFGLCVHALPEIAEGLQNLSEDLGRASELLEGTSNTIRDLSELVPL